MRFRFLGFRAPAHQLFLPLLLAACGPVALPSTHDLEEAIDVSDAATSADTAQDDDALFAGRGVRRAKTPPQPVRQRIQTKQNAAARKAPLRSAPATPSGDAAGEPGPEILSNGPFPSDVEVTSQSTGAASLSLGQASGGQVCYNTDFNVVRAQLDQLKGMGMTWVRLCLDTDFTGPKTAVGQPDFSWFDQAVAELHARGMKPFFIVSAYAGQKIAPRTDPERKAFADFTAKAAEHFKGIEARFEIWNEPNGKNFWLPKPNAEEYAAVALAAAKAFKAVPGNNNLIVAPSVSRVEPAGVAYVKRVLEAAPDLLAHIDGVSFHGYHDPLHAPPEINLPHYAALRKLVDKYTPAGRPPLPFHSSEWGYCQGVVEDERTFAQYYSRILLMSHFLRFQTSILYVAQTGNQLNGCKTSFNFLDARHNGPGSVFSKVSALNQGLADYRFEQRVKSDPETYVMKFRRVGGTDTRLVGWTRAGQRVLMVRGMKGEGKGVKRISIDGMPRILGAQKETN